MTLGVDLGRTDVVETLQRLQDENASQIDQTRCVIQEAEILEKQIQDHHRALEESMVKVHEAERQMQDARHRKESAEQQLERLRKEMNGLENLCDTLFVSLKDEVAEFGIQDLMLERLDEIEDRLIARRDLWCSRQQEKTQLEKDISALELQIHHRAEQIKAIRSDIEREQEVLGGLTRERDSLKDKRIQLFGDKNPQEEEKHLLQSVEAGEQEFKSTQQRLMEANQALELLKNGIDQLVKNLAERSARLRPQEERFLTRLSELGFLNESDFKNARLPEEERKSLEQQANALQKEIIELKTREKDVRNKLETERSKQITNLPREELERQLEALAAELKKLQEEIAAICHQLDQNEQMKRQWKKKIQALEAQKKECGRWDLLHELIGSADGKKFRIFAQSLTFEMLIDHANSQLQRMTDRYLLVHDDDQPLQLCVIDNYQAGEKRSTKNLSGGESFIVSLALALGLSSMASRKVRVDSLFLDEGFGTLDEKALEIALETLAELQQEGKLIGLISHVSALKERISTQIEVIPRVGGKSEIKGIGCRKIQ